MKKWNETQSKLVIYSRSFLRSNNIWELWIRKNKAFFNLINHQPGIDKTYLYAKKLYESKYQLLIKKKEKRHKVLAVFDDVIVDMMSSKKLNSVVTELFIRCRKLNSSLAFVIWSYYKVLKDVILNSTNQIKEIKERKSQIKESFKKLHLISHQILTLKIFWSNEKYTPERHPFLVNNTNLPLSNPLNSRQNVWKRMYNNHEDRWKE